LKGSLSATGRGHGTDRAVLAGLMGWEPESCEPDEVAAIARRMGEGIRVPWGEGTVRIGAESVVFVPFAAGRDEGLDHPNTVVFRALDGEGKPLLEEVWCSIGGGFVRRAGHGGEEREHVPATPPMHPFRDADGLVAVAEREGTGLGGIVLANERAWSGPGVVEAGLDRVWEAMRGSIRRGLERSGELPGGLGMRRRAGDLLHRVESGRVEESYRAIARAQAYAYAVNEENAAGGRVVTAPTNGAAGIVPGVLAEVADRLALPREAVHRALATAGAVGMLVKAHASLSGAEVGCQGEVGTATAMAAAALCEVLGGDPRRTEYAAEIAMEHNLGLTCDPLKGLVQAPCIERNAVGVAKAWSAAQLALHSDGRHLISLDRVIRVMKRTGDDMSREYKETSEGGLAVSLPEC
jgi:L-serine dehydratase